MAPCLFAIGFHFEVETIKVIESIEFFFRPGSATLRISEHNGCDLFILPFSYSLKMKVEECRAPPFTCFDSVITR